MPYKSVLAKDGKLFIEFEDLKLMAFAKMVGVLPVLFEPYAPYKIFGSIIDFPQYEDECRFHNLLPIKTIIVEVNNK